MAILSGSSPAPRTGSKKYSNALGLCVLLAGALQKEREICLSLICGSWASSSPQTCPLLSEFQGSFLFQGCSLYLFIFPWNRVVGRRDLFFMKGRDSDAAYLLLYMGECGHATVEFLSCLFLNLVQLCVLGNLLNSLPISSAARQMCFTGQFVVPSLFLHKWLPVVRVIRVIPPNFWCLSKIPKFRVWAPSGWVKGEDKLLESTVCPCCHVIPFQTVVFSVDSWGSLNSSISYFSSVLKGK